jgi:glycine betaine/proline transport system substrate-binding protein
LSAQEHEPAKNVAERRGTSEGDSVEHRNRWGGRRALPLSLLGVVALTTVVACGGGDIEEADAPEGGADCGDFNMAINPWVGYEASAYVVGQVAANELGCNVEYKTLKEEIAWQGMGSGEVDVVIENWGHEDLKKKYIEDQGTAVEVGPNGNIGIIGWYVPPWLADEHPEVLNWENLNDFADEFATSESGGKGQLLDGDPSFVTNDEALVQNLDLDFEVVYAGSENALIAAFEQAEENKEWVIGYFYEPQWFFQQVQLQKVSLPPYEPGCDADPEKVACDYPEYILDKIASAEFMEEDGPAARLVEAFEWTNEDQNVVAEYIAEDKMEQADAAEKWIADNPDKVEAWLETQ